jgi:hypothetical protein
MKKILFGIISLVFIASTFSSCRFEKRVHQDGYNVSWKHKHADASEVESTQIDQPQAASSPILQEEIIQNVQSSETLSASSSEDLVILPKKRTIIQTKQDTVIPDQPKTQEEYFSNNYSAPSRPNELQDTKLANWALGLGIAAVSSPLWMSLLFFLVFALVGASISSVSVWTAFGLAVLLGGGIFIALEVLAITFAIRFLKLHAKDPNYTKYRKRAITALILAGIYPALIILNIIITLAVI